MEIENHGAELIPVEVGTRTGQSLSYKFGESVKCNSSSDQLFFLFLFFFSQLSELVSEFQQTNTRNPIPVSPSGN